MPRLLSKQIVPNVLGLFCFVFFCASWTGRNQRYDACTFEGLSPLDQLVHVVRFNSQVKHPTNDRSDMRAEIRRFPIQHGSIF